jgi:hypothetical protein
VCNFFRSIDSGPLKVYRHRSGRLEADGTNQLCPVNLMSDRPIGEFVPVRDHRGSTARQTLATAYVTNYRDYPAMDQLDRSARFVRQTRSSNRFVCCCPSEQPACGLRPKHGVGREVKPLARLYDCQWQQHAVRIRSCKAQHSSKGLFRALRCILHEVPVYPHTHPAKKSQTCGELLQNECKIPTADPRTTPTLAVRSKRMSGAAVTISRV